jgi:hypothetical protein
MKKPVIEDVYQVLVNHGAKVRVSNYGSLIVDCEDESTLTFTPTGNINRTTEQLYLRFRWPLTHGQSRKWTFAQMIEKINHNPLILKGRRGYAY